MYFGYLGDAATDALMASEQQARAAEAEAKIKKTVAAVNAMRPDIDRGYWTAMGFFAVGFAGGWFAHKFKDRW